MNEKIYVKIFFEYIDFKRFWIICYFRKTLYDFKQTFKIWFDTLKLFFKKFNFLFFNVDQSVFCDEKTIIIIYVDDLLITNFNKQFNKNIKTIFNKQFHIIDFNFMIYYFDIKFDRNKFQRILWFNQRIYLKKIFKKYNFFDNKSIAIFMKTSTKLKTVFIEYIVNFDFKHIYQLIVEFFIYVMLDIRFNIVYFVFVINRYVFNFDEIHWTIIKRIFRYLKNTLYFRLIFSNFLRFLIDWIDVDWIDNKNIRRSIFDYIFNFENAIIIWFFKRQFTIVLSIYKIEYINQIQIVKKII